MLHVIAALQDENESLAHPTAKAVGERLQAMYASLGAVYAWNTRTPWYGTRPIVTDLVARGLVRIHGFHAAQLRDGGPPLEPIPELALTAEGLDIVVETLKHGDAFAVAPEWRTEDQGGAATDLPWVPLA